jgi:hypothetical protein
LERNEDAEFDQDEEDEESNDNSISTNSWVIKIFN